jgi:cell division transport system permease protein
MALSYSVREGLAGFRRAPFAAVASTSAMTVALVLVGLFLLAGYQARQVSSWLRQRVGQFNVMLDTDATESDADQIMQRARLLPGVEEVEYVSPKEAQERFRNVFGEGAEIYYEEPFLPASVEVRVAPSHAASDSLQTLIGEVETWARVDEVVFDQPLFSRVQRNLRLITWVGSVLGAVIVLASVFLVANTIRLTVYARRLLIRTMKLVGATDRFIRRPFIIEGMVQGLIAGVLAGAVVWGLHRVATSYVPGLAEVGGLWLVLPALLGGGVLLGWVGAYFAVRRFVKNVALH